MFDKNVFSLLLFNFLMEIPESVLDDVGVELANGKNLYDLDYADNLLYFKSTEHA